MGKGKYETTDLQRARDELFSHIRRCGVLQATSKQREEWMDDTIEYLAERYPSLDRKGLARLKKLGDRYCRPAIPHGQTIAEDIWDEEAEAAGPSEEAAEIQAVDARPAPAEADGAATETPEQPAGEADEPSDAEEEEEEEEKDEVKVG